MPESSTIFICKVVGFIWSPIEIGSLCSIYPVEVTLKVIWCNITICKTNPVLVLSTGLLVDCFIFEFIRDNGKTVMVFVAECERIIPGHLLIILGIRASHGLWWFFSYARKSFCVTWDWCFLGFAREYFSIAWDWWLLGFTGEFFSFSFGFSFSSSFTWDFFTLACRPITVAFKFTIDFILDCLSNAQCILIDVFIVSEVVCHCSSDEPLRTLFFFFGKDID